MAPNSNARSKRSRKPSPFRQQPDRQAKRQQQAAAAAVVDMQHRPVARRSTRSTNQNAGRSTVDGSEALLQLGGAYEGYLASLRSTLGTQVGNNAPQELLDAQLPLLVAFFTFKGGAGKTTLCVLLATTLARLGYNCVIIDADRQCNATTFHGGNPKVPSEEDLRECAERHARLLKVTTCEGGVASAGSILQNERNAKEQRMLSTVRRRKGARLQPSYMRGDRMPEGLNPMTVDYLVGRKEGEAVGDLEKVLNAYMGNSPDEEKRRVMQDAMQQAHKEEYGSSAGRGKLYILHGSRNIGNIAAQFQKLNIEEPLGVQVATSVRAMALDAAAQVKAQFVFFDMGPLDDNFNRAFTISADIVQATVNCDMYSWSALVQMMACVLPEWLRHLEEIRHAVDRLENADARARARRGCNPTFPTIHTTMAMQYDMDIEDPTKVRWADANFMEAMRDSIRALALFAKGGVMGAGLSEEERVALGEKPLLAFTELISKKRDASTHMPWLKQMMESHVTYKDIVLPLLRRLGFMPVCHEVGMQVFDITMPMLRDYYFTVDERQRLSSKDTKRLEQRHMAVEQEGQYVLEQMCFLARSYENMLRQHNTEEEPEEPEEQ